MLAHWIARLLWKGPKMNERAKILGLPKNEVLKPVLLTRKERDFLSKSMVYYMDKNLDLNKLSEDEKKEFWALFDKCQ